MTQFGYPTAPPEGDHLRCDFVYCIAGMGLAGGGKCFLYGLWFTNHCPAYIDEKEQVKKWEAEEALKYQQ